MSVRGLIKRHPVLSGAGGFALGYSAMAGNLWAILASLGIGAAYSDAKAAEAARAAAIKCGKTDPACIEDIKSPECIDHVKAAAIAAGRRRQRKHTFLIVAGIALAIIAIVNGIGHHLPEGTHHAEALAR
jgi:uncharacterized membrane protein